MAEIKLSNGEIIDGLEIVRILKKDAHFNERSEYNSNLWEEDGKWILTPARALKIGESIYHKNGKEKAWRSE